MSGPVTAMVVVLLLAFGMVAGALQARRARRQAPIPCRKEWDEDRERWTVDPASERDLAEAQAATPAVLDLAPGIDLGLRDDCELLWAMDAYQRPADHTTTNSEGDL